VGSPGSATALYARRRSPDPCLAALSARSSTEPARQRWCSSVAQLLLLAASVGVIEFIPWVVIAATDPVESEIGAMLT